MNKTSFTENKKIFAIVSHILIFMNFVGIVINYIFYTQNEEDNRFLARHALQAMGWQIFFLSSQILLILIGGGNFYLLFALSQQNAENSSTPVLFFIFHFTVIFTIILSSIAFIGFSFFAAYKAYNDMEYCYPVTGRLIKKRFPRLFSEPSQKKEDDKFTDIIPREAYPDDMYPLDKNI